MMKERYSK